MPQEPQPFTLAGYGMGTVPEPAPVNGEAPPPAPSRGEQRRAGPEGRFEIGGFNIRDPETIDDPELRELAIRYRDAQTAGEDTSELRRLLAGRVAKLLEERARRELLDPTDLALWSAIGGAAGYGASKVAGWDTRRTAVFGAVAGFGARILKGLPAYTGAKLAAAVIGGVASAQRTPEAEAAEHVPEAVGYWR